MGTKVVAIQLSGPRMLLYGTAAVVQAEGVMGKSVRDALIGQSVSDLVILLWAGLRVGASAQITRNQVMTWLDDAKKGDTVVFALWDKVAEALAASGIIPPPPTTAAPEEDENPTLSSPRLGASDA